MRIRMGSRLMPKYSGSCRRRCGERLPRTLTVPALADGAAHWLRGRRSLRRQWTRLVRQDVRQRREEWLAIVVLVIFLLSVARGCRGGGGGGGRLRASSDSARKWMDDRSSG